MKGIEFLVENKACNILYQILQNNCTVNCIWTIEENDSFVRTDDVNYFPEIFPSNVCSNKLFFESLNQNCYICFINIQLYENEEDIVSIDSKDDFLNSKCQLILLITDNVFVDLFCKNERLLEEIEENLNRLGISYKERNIRDRRTMYAHGD